MCAAMTSEVIIQSMEERRMQFIRMSALLALLAMPGLALAHPGGLDKNGCHNDKKTGDYHCHKGANAGKTFASKEAMIKETGGGAVVQPAKPAPKTSTTPAAAASAPAAAAPAKPDVKAPAPAAQPPGTPTVAAKPEAKAEPKAQPDAEKSKNKTGDAKTDKKKEKSKDDKKAEDKK
jgi:outer membrane biosynthesis protein TonB